MKNLIHSLKTASQPNKFRKLNLFVLITFIVGISLSINAAPSELDLSFGNAGKVVSSPDGSETKRAYDMALQADGKIVMVGGISSEAGFFVARYNSDGSLDTTFAANGWTNVIFENAVGNAVSVDIQPDGKIVVGGSVVTPPFGMRTIDFGIIRLNTDGSLDTTFDGDGKATVSFVPEMLSSFNIESFTKLKLTNHGKIVVAGFASDSGAFTRRFLVARLNTDGSLDTTFGAYIQ